MLDHGQLGPPTPAPTSVLTPMESLHGGSAGEPSSDTKANIPGPDGSPGLGRGMSESLSMSVSVEELEVEKGKKPDLPDASGFVHPSSISAQLYTNPNLAPLRTTGLSANSAQPPTLATVPPILVDSRCSGYFVETVCPSILRPVIPLPHDIR